MEDKTWRKVVRTATESRQTFSPMNQGHDEERRREFVTVKFAGAMANQNHLQNRILAVEFVCMSNTKY